MGKTIPIETYFKRKNDKSLQTESSLPTSNADTLILPTSNVDPSIVDDTRPAKTQRIEINEVDISSLERDPGLCSRIWDYQVNLRDEIRRVYIKAGPFQPNLSNYPKSGSGTHLRSFQYRLEYSPSKDAAFCLPCYLFSQLSENKGNNAFIVDGFRS